jgi:hypothetical protein
MSRGIEDYIIEGLLIVGCALMIEGRVSKNM